MKDKLQKNLITGLTAFLVIAASILLFFIFYKAPGIIRRIRTLLRILEPFMVGIVIAFILSPAYNKIVRRLSSLFRKKLKKKAANYISVSIAIVVLFTITFVIIYGLANLVIPSFVTSVLGIVNSLDQYSNNLYKWLLHLFRNHPELNTKVASIFQSVSKSVSEWVDSKFTPDAESLLTSLGSITNVFSGLFVGVRLILRVVKDFIIGFIAAAYFLIMKKHMLAQAKKIGYSIFNIKTFNFILDECRYIQSIFGGFIRGKLVDSLIMGLLCFFGCCIFQFPYPVVISVIVAVTNIIPFFGPFIGAIPSSILILMVSPKSCLYFIIFILVLQQFDGNIIGPRILGNITGLSSFWVLFSIVTFGGLFGFFGMVVAVPLFAVIYSLIDMFVNHKLRKKELPVATSFYELLDHIDERDKQFIRQQDPTSFPETKAETLAPTDNDFTETH